MAKIIRPAVSSAPPERRISSAATDSPTGTARVKFDEVQGLDRREPPRLVGPQQEAGASRKFFQPSKRNWPNQSANAWFSCSAGPLVRISAAWS